METSVACPMCGRSFHVPPELLGMQLRCPECHHVFAAQASPAATAVQSGAPAALPATARLQDWPPEEEPPSRLEAPFQRADYDVPGYLWPLTAVPWGLLLFALGGWVSGLLGVVAAAALSATGVAVVMARQFPVRLRLAGLLVLDGVAGLGMVAAVALLIALPAGPGSGPSSNAPAQPEAVAPARALFRHGPRVYLADLPEFGVQAGPWPFTKDGTVGNGQPIAVNGVRSPKGLGMHPPAAPGFASVRYRLGKQAALFRAVVAINDTTKWCWSPAVFTVLGDGRPLWQSVGIAHNHAHTQACSVDVSGVDELELRVQCINGNQGVHAVWVEPRLLQKANTPDG